MADSSGGSAAPGQDAEILARLKEGYLKIKSQLAEVIVGQEQVVEEVVIAVFSRGHVLLVGVPGLAKTLLVSSLAQTMDLSFRRIQFTPDLMPSDITGTEVIQQDRDTGERHLRFIEGPIFANVVLADEINRTPPKTQAALLEAMQERHVTVGRTTYPLPEPFFVLATQNPIEQEGTYPLPEAQLDRFMFNIKVNYPTSEEETQIIRRVTSGRMHEIKPILTAKEILALQELVYRIPVADHMIEYAKTLARLTRPKEPEAPQFIRDWLTWGAGPRAGLYMIWAAKARAALAGRNYVSADDIAAVAHPVLRHRLITNFVAQADGIDTDTIITKLLEMVPKYGD
ncbi:MAG: MoxR family ATPase [Candidatus Sumerlaeia bacterium]|nr:MoxR family ATPase [Candidatus Sumerlaeia bacterium]